MFSALYWNQPVLPCVLASICVSVHVFVCVSVCVQNTSFCQTAGRGIKSHLVTYLVLCVCLHISIFLANSKLSHRR